MAEDEVSWLKAELKETKSIALKAVAEASYYKKREAQQSHLVKDLQEEVRKLRFGLGYEGVDDASSN